MGLERVGGRVQRDAGAVSEGPAARAQADSGRGARSFRRATRSHLHAVVASLPGAVLLEDRQGRVVFANEAFCRTFRLCAAAEELAGCECAALMARVSPLLAHPDVAAEDAGGPLAEELAFSVEELTLADGRVLEREYVPVVTNGATGGHLWIFRDITRRKQRERELVRQATTDGLTGVMNRRCFLERFAEELLRTHRFRTGGALLMCDIDHFKGINDRHGHAAGDAVLKEFAAVAGATLRSIDLFGRMGGEEFAAFLPGCDLADAVRTAERLRCHVAAAAVCVGETRVALTVSVGVARVTAADEYPESALIRADRALYRAKAGGRNRVAGEQGPEGGP